MQRLLGYVSGVIGAAMVVGYVLRPAPSAAMLNAMNAGFATSVKAAMGDGPIYSLPPTLSPAERFTVAAMDALEDWWKGFE